MKRVIAFKRTCSMCRDIFIPDASMTPLPLSPRFPLPPPHLTLRGLESERSKYLILHRLIHQHDASAYSKKLLERGPMINEYR